MVNCTHFEIYILNLAYKCQACLHETIAKREHINHGEADECNCSKICKKDPVSWLFWFFHNDKILISFTFIFLCFYVKLIMSDPCKDSSNDAMHSNWRANVCTLQKGTDPCKDS
jgi:hypothetical protein